MINLSRRKLIVSGLAVTAGASGLAVAARLAQKYGLVPPDHGGVYGIGETLTYASQRLLTRHSLAREFPRSGISPRPFPNELAPLTEQFKRLQAGGFADWRLSVDGMVQQPGSFSIADLKSYPSRSHRGCLRIGSGSAPCQEVWIGSSRSWRNLRPGRNAELCLTAAADEAFAGARIPSKPDFAASIPERTRATHGRL